MKSLHLSELKQAARGHFQSGVFHRLNARLLQERSGMYENLLRDFPCLRDATLIANLNRALGDAVVAVEEAHRREGVAP